MANVGEDVENREPLIHCWWDWKLAQSVWKSMELLAKKKQKQNHHVIHTSEYVSEESKDNSSKKYMLSDVHSSNTYNS